MKKMRLHVFLLMLFSLAMSAQEKRVITEIDTTRNLLGAQFNLTLKTRVDTAARVVFPGGQQFGLLEILQVYPTDTIRDGATMQLIQKYGLTQFDSGRYVIPRLPVQIGAAQFLSDSISVEVMPVKVDTLRQKMYDIKDVVAANEGSSKWWIYLLILIALATAAFFGYRFWQKRNVQKVADPVFKTPIEKATVLLQQLEQKGLWQRGEVKNYYSELTDIARNYIEEAIHIPAMESTTSELIVALRMAAAKKNMALSAETVANLESVLKHADLVKFAKSRPAEFEIAEDRAKLEKSIITLDKSIPEEVVDDSAERTELLRQQMLKKQKRRKIMIAAGSVVGLLFLIAIFFTITKGFYYVTDNVFGNPTKELLEGEWITSQYGNPSVHIETPEVLLRTDAEKYLPKESLAVLKEFQMFTFGGMNMELFVQVSTNKFKEPREVDLALVVEGSIKDWEAQGAHSIIVKQEEFDTNQGITGVKAYGTMQILDKESNRSQKVYYEMLFFKQDQGLQQIVVAHVEGDRYGPEILRRIISSVELKQLTQ